MSFGAKGFGRRAPRQIHGSIPLGPRRRVYCVITNLRESVIYLNIAEYVTIPFHFRIEFEGGTQWLACEFKTQKDAAIVAQIIGASDEASNATPQSRPAEAFDVDVVDSWRGRK
jgi:hypothetical protein